MSTMDEVDCVSFHAASGLSRCHLLVPALLGGEGAVRSPHFSAGMNITSQEAYSL